MNLRNGRIRNIYTALRELLLKQQESTGKLQHQCVDTGPNGRLDTYQLLGENGKGAWKISLPKQGPKSKFIIFADDLFYLRDHPAYEIELWDDLMANHAVFLWRGKEVPLNYAPVTDRESFQLESKNMQPDSHETIAKTLTMQGHYHKDQ